jgi:hypothetical protein
MDGHNNHVKRMINMIKKLVREKNNQTTIHKLADIPLETGHRPR